MSKPSSTVREYLRTAKIAGSHLLHISSVPFSIIHFVTNRCNLRCKHCFIYGDFEQQAEDERYSKDELELAQIEKLTRSMKGQLGVVSLTGGEPFLRSDLLQIATAYVHNAGARLVEVSTNGFLIEPIEKFVKDFLETTEAHLYISISFDGLRESHDQNRGKPGAFEKAVEAARFLQSLGQPRLQTSATVTVFNQPTNEMVELFDFLVNDVKVNTISTVALRDKPLDNGNLQFNFECYRKLNQLVQEHILSGKLAAFESFHSGDLIKAGGVVSRQRIERTLRENQFITPCTAGRVLAIIYADGSVYPCEILHKKMGDLHEFDMDLPALMRSTRARQIRNDIHVRKCFCSFECAWTYNVIYEPRNWKKLMAEYLKLRTRKTVRT